MGSPPSSSTREVAASCRANSWWGSSRGRTPPPSREGLGAQVSVVLPDGRRLLKVFDGKSGYLSQSDLPLYFGLAGADHAAAIEVRWPSGRRQNVAGSLKADQTIDVAEP